MRCRVQPCPHAMGTLRTRSRARVAVVRKRRRGTTWLLTLACGHPAARPVQRKVYAPYPLIAAPRFCYCPVCPPSRSIRSALAKATRATLDPEAPGLDEDTRARRRSLADMQRMSTSELFALAVRAGIYTKTGRLTKPYRSTEPSAHRPTD